MIDVWNWYLWCGNEIQVLSQVFLKTSTLHAVTAEVTELNNRKIRKRRRVFPARGESWNMNSQKRKSFKKHESKTTFLLIFYAKQRRLKRYGKTIGKAVIAGNFKRGGKRSPYDSGVLLYWLTVLTCTHFNRPMMSQRKVVYRRFPQFWLIFPNRNYTSRSWRHVIDKTVYCPDCLLGTGF